MNGAYGEFGFRTLFHGSASGESPPAAGFYPVRDQEDLVRRWESLTGGQFPAPELPRIDLGYEAVLLLALAARSQSGNSITIDRLSREDGLLVVDATEVRNEGVGASVVLFPAHLVAVGAPNVPAGDVLLRTRLVVSR
ncbi:hypothetical protein [Actinoplanes utahensis]|uniref:Uncharacterized protein n=1 Tax=Actinoplanes utahensis TaxID=1869 RepID=A0A0A6WXU2_ACTUT|nr:hypothetical protein [Actinoplanes utahensis]KHD72522.1 hypothetical protein MB27_39430 [Actinoplanes utahensis]GIF29360.1 hypothetical protein Aut01nite_23460 [Actinoplanes utahensis]